ncbi:MAG: PQQ-dependent sugar dehydrogenase [Anaerolineae bacterium]|nr:PQQ-dependent sugar dehydrogenase [Anaerolineae bacterium]
MQGYKKLFHIVFFVVFLTAVAVVAQAGLAEVDSAEARSLYLSAAPMGENTVYLPVIFLPILPAPPIHAVPFSGAINTDTITDIASAGDERLFVTARQGIIYIVQPDGQVLPTPFLNITELVTIQNWEQGMLGLVFHPNYPATPHFYVSYTRKFTNQVEIARYSVSQTNPNVADKSTARLLMRIDKTELLSLVHNGGDLNFGPDGYLYIGIGDGGPDPHYGSPDVHDPANNGHRLDTLLGKILRIDVNGTGLPPQDSCNRDIVVFHYTIPPDNPFADGSGPHCDEIWARGVRNPWRFSFDHATGDLFIADVGEWEREEVNREVAGSPGGLNYGWRCWEGSFDQRIPHPEIAGGCLPQAQYTFPIYEYDQSEGCSIVGGFVYNGRAYPALRGHYVFGDFCNGVLKVLSRSPGSENEWFKARQIGTGLFISTFGEDAAGELYMGTWNSSNQARVYRIVAGN